MIAKCIQISFKYLLAGVIILSACSYSGVCQNNPYKQIRIPLDALKGVPFTKGEEGWVVWGFDIDSGGDFYFTGGTKATLACFLPSGKYLYRKSFLNFHPGPIHIAGKELYMLDTWNWVSNTLIEIDRTSGAIIRQYPNTITKALKSRGFKSIEDYRFSDSTLSITYTDSGGIDKPKTIWFNLKGELLPNRNQNTPNGSAVEKDNHFEYLGKLGNNFVLGRFDEDGKRYALSLRDSSNAVIANSVVDLKYAGEPMCGFSCMPPEHRKLRNNMLYMLNRDKNMAVITEIDLVDIFHVR